MERRKNQSTGRMIAYISFTLLFSCLFLEIAIRFLAPSDIIEPAVPNSIGQFDEQLGWGLKPNARATSNRIGYPISYEINSKGLRDVETSLEKPKGIFRIVLIGDSRTFGFGVPIEKHFSTIIEGYFNDVEVINLGVGGYGVGQELLSLRLNGFQYEPDLVIAYVAHYGSQRHMHTNRWGREKPRFILRDKKLTLVNTPVSPPKKKTKSRVDRIKKWIVAHSRTIEIVDRAVRSTLDAENNAIAQRKKDDSRLLDKEFTDELYQLGAEIIFSMDAESSEHGAEFLLVTHIDKLHQSALEHGVRSIDVSEALRNPSFPLPDELKHINESGNGVLAWEIARMLKGSGLIPANHRY